MSKPDIPETPDYAEATREGIMADIDTLPLRRMIEFASKAGTKVTYTDPDTGEEKTSDFTGMGDIELSRLALDFGIESAEKLSVAKLEQDEKYAERTIQQRLKELQISDPEGFAARKEMGQSILEGIRSGSELSPEMQEQVEQAERAGQAARGNIMGQSSGAAEAMSVGDAGFRLYQQRLANAASFLSGTTPVAQFGQISGASQGATAFNPQAMAQGIAQNQNAAQSGWNAAAQNWGMGFQKAQYEHEQSPWNKLFEGAIAAGVSAAGGATGAGLV